MKTQTMNNMCVQVSSMCFSNGIICSFINSFTFSNCWSLSHERTVEMNDGLNGTDAHKYSLTYLHLVTPSKKYSY